MQTTLYLSPSGNDGLSGLQPGKTGVHGPLKTLCAALQRVRSLRESGEACGPSELLMAPGLYPIERPVIFRPEDSDITVRATETGQTCIRGSVPLNGFGPVELEHGVQAWRKDVSAHLDRYGVFRSLFLDGHRLQRARWPHTGFSIVDHFAFKHAGVNLTEGRHHFFGKPEDWPVDWTPGENIEVNIIHYWVHERAGVEHINPVNGEIVMDRKTGMNPHFGPYPPTYYLENDKRFLTKAGDWFLDESEGALYIVPQKTWSLEEFTVEAPVTTQWIRLAGEYGKPVRNVTFEGIDFEYADWQRGAPDELRWEPDPDMPPRPDRPILPHHKNVRPHPRPTTAAIQGSVCLPGTIQARAAEHCRFERCHFTGSSFYTFLLEDGCRNNRVAHSQFREMGAGAVYLDGSPDPMEPQHHNALNTVRDCDIRSGGHVFADACGIFATHCAFTRIEHNHIEDFPYTGISIGWRWAFDAGVNRDQRIVANVVRRMGIRGGLSDMGGIYLLGYQPGSVVLGNVVEDIHTAHYGGWGLYLDEGSSGIRVEHNLVWNTASHSVHEHWGRQNSYRHNLFAFGGQGGIMVNHDDSHGWVTHPAPGSRAEYNIILTKGQPAFHDDDGLLNNKGLEKGFFSHDHNLMWDQLSAKKMSVWMSSDWHDPAYKACKLNLTQIRKLGQELNGCITDPGIQRQGKTYNFTASALPGDFPFDGKQWNKAGPRKIDMGLLSHRR